jgi:hypothetical protein
MKLHKTEQQILEHLAESWVKSRSELTSIPNACILAGNFTHRILEQLEVPHQVRAIGATIFNQKGWELFGTPNDELPDDAWSVHCSSRSAHIMENGWSGHLIVETENFFIDLTAEAFARPAHHINIFGPLIVPSSQIKELPHGTPVHQLGRTEHAYSFDLLGGIYTFYYEDWNRVYEKAPDWRVSWGELGCGRVVEAIQVK